MEKSKKRKKLIIVLIVLLLIIGVLVMLIRNAIGGATSKIKWNSQTCGTVQNRDLLNYVNLSGNVSSSDRVSISCEQVLKVSKLNVKVGDSVKKGDILCEFDSSSLKEQFDTLSSNSAKAEGASNYSHSLNQRNLTKARQERADMIAKAQAAIDNAKAKRDQAYNDYNILVDRFNDLNADAAAAYDEMVAAGDDTAAADAARENWKELTSKIAALDLTVESVHSQLPAYDDAVDAAIYNDTVKTADGLVQSAQDALDAEKYTVSDGSADKQLKELQEKIASCIVKAPKDGVVTQLSISEGSVPMSNNLMTIENTSELVISGKVNEADILRINEGMNAEIKTSATGSKIINGKVTRIERIISSGSSISDSALGAATSGGYTVEVSISDKDSELLIGMSASVKIILDKRESALSVPYDAVIGGENDGYFVYVATPAEGGKYTLSKRSVTIGFEGDYYTEIVSGDLKVGDIVLTSPSNVSDGDTLSLDAPEE